MIDLIEALLFTDRSQQQRFIQVTNQWPETIGGNTVTEKLSNLLINGSERSVQLILAPFLRESVYRHFNENKSEFAKATRKEFIRCSGESIYEQCLRNFNDNTDNNALDDRFFFKEFAELHAEFVFARGEQIWQANPARTDNETLDFEQGFLDLKTHFFLEYPPYSALYASTIESFEPYALSHNIMAGPDSIIQDFMNAKRSFVQIFGHEQWSKFAKKTFIQSLPPIGEESLNFPSTPTAEQAFYATKQKFIAKYGRKKWQDACHFIEIRQEKIKLIAEEGLKEWSRLFVFDPMIGGFDQVKIEFIKKWGEPNWNACLNSDNFAELDQELLADFQERKQAYVEHWNKNNNPDAWEQALLYPPIPISALNLLNQLKAEFIQNTGRACWDQELIKHSNHGEFAKAVQLECLGEIFNFRIEVTDILDNITRTTIIIRRAPVDKPILHLYCENNTHYYVHENGYFETIGDGNCGYNAFAQWLKFLVLQQQPKIQAIKIPSTLVDPRIDALIAQTRQSQRLDQPLYAEPASVNDELTMNSLRMTLTLKYITTATLLAKLIEIKAKSLILIIKKKNFPGNRIALLENLSDLARKLGKDDSKEPELQILLTILLGIFHSVYFPNTRDSSVDPTEEWNSEKFKNNITELTNWANESSNNNTFGELARAIIVTDFNDNNPENRLQMIQPISSRFQPGPPKKSMEEEEISAILSIAGILILTTGIACLASMIILALVIGPAQLGILLLQCGLQNMATNLAGILAFSQPFSAILGASAAATALSGLGLMLFKEFAPQSILENSPLFSSRIRIL